MADGRQRSRHDEAAARHERGLQSLRNDQAAHALPDLRQAIELDPGNPEFLKSLGNAQRATGDLEGAAASYRRALEIAPDYLPSRYNLGLVLAELGRPEEAEPEIRRVLEANPRDADALLQLALLTVARGDRDGSAALLESAVTASPRDPYLRFQLALTYREMPARRADAIACLLSALKDKPDFPEVHHLLGDLLRAESRVEEAEIHYRKAIALDPGNAEAHAALGDALQRQHRLDEAIAAYRAAIARDAGLAHAHFNLGTACGLKGAHDEAIRSYEATLKLRPGDASALGLLLFEKLRICDWSRFDALCESLRKSVVEQPEHEIHPFGLLCIPSTPAEQLVCARNYAARRARAVEPDRKRLDFRFDRREKDRLRIGYLSFDFREHPGAYLMADLVETHDRGRLEVIAYSYGPDDGSEVRARLSRAFDRFVDLRAMNPAEAATRIHRDNVDILVNCTGYTAYNRTEINALRPAPIQVNFLGYPGTLGADFMDYIVTDRFITRPGHERHYSEQPVYMPGSYQVNDRKRPLAVPVSRDALGLPRDKIVYACFNQVSKIDPVVFSAWMRVLKSVPDSVLWLYGQNAWSTGNLRREALQRGIGPERLMFVPRCPYPRYLSHLRAADLFLDTLHYNGHTTASDALWAGLPVVTVAGETFASRVGGSLLTAIDLSDLVTDSLDDYEALIVALSRDPERRASLREKLDRSRATAPLFDTPAYTRHLESAYRQMWQLHVAGTPPRPIQP